MANGLLFECDDTVAAWTYETYHTRPLKYDKAIGVVDESGRLLGGIIFQNWNGSNIELSYYGVNTISLGIVRCIARVVISQFDVARLTVLTSKKNRRFMRALCKIGFRLEGVQRCFYGKRDCNRNTAVRFVAFREQIEKVAKWCPNANGPPSTILPHVD